MFDDKMILNGLIELGFTERQAKIYLVLYKKNNANLSELQKLTGIRQDKLSEILNNLIMEGYCSEKKIGRRKCFSITNPKTSITNTIKKMEKRLENSYKLAENLKTMYKNIDDNKEPFEYIEVFHGNDNIHYNYCELVKKSKTEILSFTKEPFAFHTQEKIKEQEKVITDFLMRKGTVKTIYEKRLFINNPDSLNIIKQEIPGDEVRVIENLPLKMFIFDKNTLFIADVAPLNISDEQRMVLIKQQAIVNAFAELFKFFWNNAIDINAWANNQNE